MERPTQASVLETKLIPPTVSGTVIRRQRLISKALLGVQTRLVLLDAPAGYGKTSVLAQVHKILADERRRVAWISLDEADNDHARFLCHIAAAIRQSGARFGNSTMTLLGSGAPLPPSILRTSLLNEIVALDEDLYVFLDDYHYVVDREVRETIRSLLSAPLPRLHLVVASRGRNELPLLGRMRTLGQLTHINGAEMAFSEAEAGEFLGRACKVPLEQAQVSQLCARTEGWAASLQLACIALGDVADVAGFLNTFSGETRSVGDLLVEEVLQRLSPELQKFLMETSVLSRFSVGLANAVTCSGDGRRTVDEIEAKNLFLFSLDEQRTWYRYHHLFADFLRRRLVDRDPSRLAELHHRAAEWLSRNNCLTEAIDHAFLAGDTERAGAFLELASGQLYAIGQVETLHKQSARLPPQVLRRLPRLQLELGWDQEIEWRFEEARATLDSVRDCLEPPPPQSGAGLETEASFLTSKLAHREMMLMLLTDRLSEAAMLCDRWKAQTPSKDPFMLASVGTTMMVANREQYLCDGVSTGAAGLRDLFLRGGAIYGTVFHDCATGTVLFMRGDVTCAEQAFERARRCAIELHGDDSKLAAMPTTMLAELCYERGELARASELLARHPSFSAEFGWVDHAIARFVTAARLAFAEHRFDDADDALEAGHAVAEKHNLSRLRWHILAEQVRQFVARGDGKAAAALLGRSASRESSRTKAPGAAPTVTDELIALSWARIAIDRGEGAAVVAALRKWLAFTRNRRCIRSHVRVAVVLSHALACSGDTNGARRTVTDLLLAVPKAGFVRSFVDEGPSMVSILSGLLEDHSESDGDTWQRLSRILVGQEVRPGPAAGASEFAPSYPGSLSARELDILRFSAQGMANSDISRVVNLSENTVKWYWNRIFSKLQVHRRFDAIKAARQRRLLA